MAYEIDDNVPLFKKPYHAQKGVYSELRTTMRKLKVNQSIVLYGEKEAARARGAINREKHLNGKLWTILRDPKNPDFYRLWRTR